jgi:DNA-binding NarL/FixJ family response regulator
MSYEDINAFLEAEGAPTKRTDVERPPILIVDDDPTIRASLTAVLQKRYQLILCPSAREGVEAVNDDVCVAILDVKMGKYDGFWACNQIRKKCPDLPVIFYSAYQDAKDPYDVINEHRPFGYITKSGDSKRLIEAIDLAVAFYSRLVKCNRLLENFRKHRQNGA